MAITLVCVIESGRLVTELSARTDTPGWFSLTLLWPLSRWRMPRL
jgi:hypothetical protein